MFFLLFASALSYVFAKTIYRLYLHPLASFPGPKLAASTSLFNAYHDILGTGYVKLFPELHKKYGPIIRIQPNELHIEGLSGYNQYVQKLSSHLNSGDNIGFQWIEI